MNKFCPLHDSCLATMICLHPECAKIPLLCSACLDEQLHKDHVYFSAFKFKKEIEVILSQNVIDNPFEQQRYLKHSFDCFLNELEMFKQFIINSYYDHQIENMKKCSTRQNQIVSLNNFLRNTSNEEEVIKEAPAILKYLELVCTNSKLELTLRQCNANEDQQKKLSKQIHDVVKHKFEDMKEFFQIMRTAIDYNLKGKFDGNYSVECYEPIPMDLDEIKKQVQEDLVLQIHQKQIENLALVNINNNVNNLSMLPLQMKQKIEFDSEKSPMFFNNPELGLQKPRRGRPPKYLKNNDGHKIAAKNEYGVKMNGSEQSESDEFQEF